MSNAQSQGLGGTRHQNPQEHIVANLGNLARTGFTSMKNVLAHGFQVRTRLFQRRILAPDHKGQGAGHCAASTTGNRRIQHQQTQLGRLGRQILAGLSINRAAINQHCAGGHGLQQAVLALVNLTNVATSRQHGKDHLRVFGDLHRRLAHLRPRCLQLLHGLCIQVKDLQAMAGFEQIQRHGFAHMAQPDKCNRVTHFVSSSL